jgi:hypothetical protein
VPLLFLLGLCSCTRPTVGFCNVDEDCDVGSYCGLPAHECTTGTVIRGVFSGGQVLPPTASLAAGAFELIVSSDQSSGSYTLQMTTPVQGATSAQLIQGSFGSNGNPVSTIMLDGNGNATGTMNLDPDTVAGLKVGEFYLLVPSPAFPNGEARAQLYSDNPSDTNQQVQLYGTLSGLQVSPSNTSQATGTVSLMLDETNVSVTYNFSYMQLQDTVTGVHVHDGSFNINGPHIFDLPDSVDSMTSSTGTLDSSYLLGELSDPNLYQAQRHLWQILLKSGVSYFNIHSTMFVIGEIRAQLLPTMVVPPPTITGPFNTPLAAQNGMGAQGQGQFFLSADNSMLAYRLDHTVTSPTGAVIAKGPMSNMTPLACPALASSGGASGAQGYCPVSATATGNAIYVGDLKQGVLYLVIESTAMPMGEIAGQMIFPTG